MELRRSRLGGGDALPAETASTAAEISDETLGDCLCIGGSGAGRGAVNRDFGEGIVYFAFTGEGLSLEVPVLMLVSDEVELRREGVRLIPGPSRSLEALFARGVITGAARERRGAMLLRRASFSALSAAKRSAVVRPTSVAVCDRDVSGANMVDGRGGPISLGGGAICPVRSIDARFTRGVYYQRSLLSTHYTRSGKTCWLSDRFAFRKTLRCLLLLVIYGLLGDILWITALWSRDLTQTE